MKKKLSMQVKESVSTARGLSDKTLKTYQEHLLCISKHLDITTLLSNFTKQDAEDMQAVTL